MRTSPAAGRAALLSILLTSLAAFACALAAQTPTSKPFRILVSNDDGVRAPGILAVAQALASIGEITIVAPSENQSGKGHSIATTDPIFLDRVTLAGGLDAYSLATTPASCVKVAVGALMPQKPDLVVSGINRGYNLGRVTYVSGTVGAAREAALQGIPAVAASLAVEQTDYTAAAAFVKQVVELVRQTPLESGVLLNVNVPPGTQNALRGLRLTRQSQLTGTERFEEQKTPSGRRFFFSVWSEPTGDVEGTDVWAVEHGYVAVTPLRATEFDQKTYDAWKATIPPK
jgi:5'-nucleotidase